MFAKVVLAQMASQFVRQIFWLESVARTPRMKYGTGMGWERFQIPLQNYEAQ